MAWHRLPAAKKLGVISRLRQHFGGRYIFDFPSFTFDRDASLSPSTVSAGNVAEIAYALLSSAADLLPPRHSHSDPGDGGFWLKNCVVFDPNIRYHTNAIPRLDDIFEVSEEDRREMRQAWDECLETEPPAQVQRRSMVLNFWCALSVLLKFKRSVQFL